MTSDQQFIVAVIAALCVGIPGVVTAIFTGVNMMLNGRNHELLKANAVQNDRIEVNTNSLAAQAIQQAGVIGEAKGKADEIANPTASIQGANDRRKGD